MIYNLNNLFVLIQPILFIDVDSQNGACNQRFMCGHLRIANLSYESGNICLGIILVVWKRSLFFASILPSIMTYCIFQHIVLNVVWTCSDGSDDRVSKPSLPWYRLPGWHSVDLGPASTSVSSLGPSWGRWWRRETGSTWHWDLPGTGQSKLNENWPQAEKITYV